MKYSEITKEKAREICRQFRVRDKNTFHFSSECEKCPLRRTTMRNGKEITLFCYYTLMEITQGAKEISKKSTEHLEQEEQALLNEDIHHEEEYRKFIEQCKQ